MKYSRIPLPKYAKMPVGWMAFCFISLIFSPFAGFAMHGKVAVPGLILGIQFAIIPLAALSVITISHWYAWRQLPLHIQQEWKYGRIFPADEAPTIASSVRFSSKKYWIEMLPDGLSLSANSLLTMHGVPEAFKMRWVAEQAGHLFISWSDIIEWVVAIDSDGPDFVILKLRIGGTLKLRRFQPDAGTECDILDAVRGVGKLPVRLTCDLPCR